jgi:predicted enzyme related to lactoylglutathione lyase
LRAGVSAVLFAADAPRLARFYVAVFGASVRSEDPYHAALDVDGFRLTIHQIPAHFAKDITIGSPPLRREMTAIRLNYPVRDLVKSRMVAKQLGGQIDEAPPAWATQESRFFLGFDPEGNVFGVTEGNA